MIGHISHVICIYVGFQIKLKGVIIIIIIIIIIIFDMNKKMAVFTLF